MLRERSWRCSALHCRDYLTASTALADDGLYLAFDWNDKPGSLRERLTRSWRVLVGQPEGRHEFAVADPAVARDIAAWLSAGADRLEQEG